MLYFDTNQLLYYIIYNIILYCGTQIPNMFAY